MDANGGSRLAIDGTFSNQAALSVGNGILGAESLVTAGALVNTGTINLTGGKTEAVLQVNSAAPTTWDGTLNFNVGTVLDQPSGPAELIYQSGSLQTIAASGAIYLWGQAYVADAATPNSNSALRGLNSIAGTLSVDFGDFVSIGGDLVVTGYLGVDEHQFDGFDNSGGSTMSIAGTLTNKAGDQRRQRRACKLGFVHGRRDRQPDRRDGLRHRQRRRIREGHGHRPARQCGNLERRHVVHRERRLSEQHRRR